MTYFRTITIFTRSVVEGTFVETKINNRKRKMMSIFKKKMRYEPSPAVLLAVVMAQQ